MNTFLPLFALAILSASCSQAPKKLDSESPVSRVSKPMLESAHHIEISYILGHDLYQYISDANEKEITIKFSRNHQPVNQRVISRTAHEKPAQNYSIWTTKVREFIITRSPASDLTGCRSPYNVTVREGEKANFTRGCRTGAEGTTLSRIARDADFLLYSQK